MKDINFTFLEYLTTSLHLAIRDEYSTHKMSGNLVKSIKTYKYPKEKSTKLVIEAPRYDIWTYWYKRVIVPLNDGCSYAVDNDAYSGGLKRSRKGRGQPIKTLHSRKKLWLLPTHNHDDFVERCIREAVIETCRAYDFKNYTIKTKGRR